MSHWWAVNGLNSSTAQQNIGTYITVFAPCEGVIFYLTGLLPGMNPCLQVDNLCAVKLIFGSIITHSVYPISHNKMIKYSFFHSGIIHFIISSPFQINSLTEKMDS